MKISTLLISSVLSFMSGQGLAAYDNSRSQEASKTQRVVTPEQAHFYALRDSAKQSFKDANFESAKQQSLELLALAPKFPNDWNYGNAIHDGNMVLGLIALNDGKVSEAKIFLAAAGKTPGSPQLNSFGPNMSLAKALLEKGERVAVIEYFALCRGFWELHRDYLDRWTLEVKNGQIPDFKANLLY